MLICKWQKAFLFSLILSIFYIIYILFFTSSNFAFNFLENHEKCFSVNKQPGLPWYFRSGTIRPSPNDNKGLWPNESTGDRILNQLSYVSKSKLTKKIFVVESKYAYLFRRKIGREIFSELKCPVNDCMCVDDRKTADAVVFGNEIPDERNSTIPKNQIWILYILENPLRYGKVVKAVNWTATYRRDSDIEVPYAKWLYYDENVKFKKQSRNYAKNKTKKVAWFVSNCKSVKNKRMEYAKELQKYIQVDIYGTCGDKACPRFDKKFDCMKMLAEEYKFYLAFENGNCKDYITEKFFSNSLQHDVLPIVMGAHPDDYERVAPFNSYIHVDHFSSPKALANYLQVLDENDYLYNSYFQWRGTGEFIDNRFLCRLCAMLHSNHKVQMYNNFTNWWNNSEICVKESWLH